MVCIGTYSLALLAYIFPVYFSCLLPFRSDGVRLRDVVDQSQKTTLLLLLLRILPLHACTSRSDREGNGGDLANKRLI